MVNIETLISDPYNRKARLQPALLTLLPVLAASALLVPEFQSKWAAVVGLLVYCGGAMWLTQFARDRGKALEPSLYQEWGGKPSVAMLRHSDDRISKATKARYRAFLESSVPELHLASPQDEERSLAHADDGYESATAWLLAQTRDREKFRLIFEENINYGFRRNIWALKPLALFIDGLVVTVIAAIVAFSWESDVTLRLQTVDNAIWAGLIFTVVHMFAFSLVIRRLWVRVPAEAYAQQLLAACDVLGSDGKR